AGRHHLRSSIQARASTRPRPGPISSSTGSAPMWAITTRPRPHRAGSPTGTDRSAGSPRASPPLLLATERGDVEVRPRAPHVLVAAAVDEVRAEDVVAL